MIDLKYQKAMCMILVCLLVIQFSSCNYFEIVEIPNHRLQWWLDDIGWAEKRTNVTGENIKIAIIDSGVDTEHNDIKNSVIKNIKVSGLDKSFIDNNSHGTAVAAIICGNCKNKNGIWGIAVNSEIISIDVTDDSSGIVEEDDLIEGISIAINENVDIINISLGVKKCSDKLHSVIKTAYDNDIIIVAAAGNYMEHDVLYPASYQEVICVGSKSKNGEVISPESVNGKAVIYLPGEYISSAARDNKYKSYSGTSISTPMLTGIISLMLEHNPDIGKKDIYDYFSVTTSKVDVKKCLNLKRSDINE